MVAFCFYVKIFEYPYIHFSVAIVAMTANTTHTHDNGTIAVV